MLRESDSHSARRISWTFCNVFIRISPWLTHPRTVDHRLLPPRLLRVLFRQRAVMVLTSRHRLLLAPRHNRFQALLRPALRRWVRPPSRSTASLHTVLAPLRLHLIPMMRKSTWTKNLW